MTSRRLLMLMRYYRFTLAEIKAMDPATVRLLLAITAEAE